MNTLLKSSNYHPGLKSKTIISYLQKMHIKYKVAMSFLRIEKLYLVNTNHEKARVYKLILENVDFREKSMNRDR